MFSLSSSVIPLIIVTLAAAASLTVGALAGIRPQIAGALIVGIVFALGLFRLGRDASLIWLLIVPWQFLPGINASIVLNPWLWAGLLRLATARRTSEARHSKLAVAAMVTLPASYILAGLLFGVAEPSLMTWLIPFIPLALSLIVVPPNFSVVSRHLYIVGVVMAILVIAETLTGWSLNELLRSNMSVQEYLRSGRALGSTGNPLFTSSVLLVAFFMPFRSNAASIAGRVVIVAAIVLTGSKSAVIGVALGLLLFAFSKGFKRFAVSLSIITAALVAFQLVADNAFNGILRRFAVFSDLRSSDPDRAFTTEFILSWIKQHPAGGAPVGSALIDKRILSPVAGGSRFGIESTWLAMAADSGVILVGIALLLVGLHCFKYRSMPASHALFALTVSLFFWNGLYGSWVITPLLLVMALLPVGSRNLEPDMQGLTENQSRSVELSQ